MEGLNMGLAGGSRPGLDLLHVGGISRKGAV
ncbi:hypothetical protein C8K63_107143 [Pseudomonas sp. GV085]|nr:hypothetical protein C8K63_107143 [Pseudomonas sp. GV085]